MDIKYGISFKRISIDISEIAVYIVINYYKIKTIF